MSSRTAVLGLCLLALAAAPGVVPAQPTAAVQVALYEEEVSFERSGDAVVTTRIELAGEAPSRLLLPFGHEVAEDLSVRSSVSPLPGESLERIEATVVEVAGTKALELRSPVPSGSLPPVTVRYTLPRLYDWSAPPEAFGNRRLAHQLVQTQHLKIDRYRLRLILPEGFRVNAVLETTPPFNPKKASELPFELGEEHGRATVELVAHGLALGDRAGLKLEAKSAKRSSSMLIAGLVVCVLYLVFYRDVLRPSEEAKPS